MNWFESWFNTPYYHILYQNRDYQEAEYFITHLLEELDLPAGSKIIDLACGKGRHSVFLNKKGFDVLGVDLSDESIAHNKQFENETLHFQVQDMREPIDTEPVDAVFNLFTSFGYFDDEKDDARVFQAVADVLKPDGYFVLDFLNHSFVRNTLTKTSSEQRGELHFDIQKKIEDNRVIKDIRFTDNGQNYHYQERVKLHTPEELVALAEKHGLEKLKIWGDYRLGGYTENSPRSIIWFRKK